MLYVAQEPVNIDTIAEAFITSSNWLDRDDEWAIAFPPIHVFRNLFAGWGWLTTIQHNRFSPREPMLKSVLGESEQGLVNVIESFGGVAMRHEILSVLVGNPYAVTSPAVGSMLASSPIVEKVEHGMYRLRGRRLNLQAIAEARLRSQTFRGIESISLLPGQPIAVAVTQSGSDEPLSRRVVYIPISHFEHIQGVFTHASGINENILVKSNGQVRRLSAIAHGLGILQKEVFNLIFNLETRTYEIRKDV